MKPASSPVPSWSIAAGQRQTPCGVKPCGDHAGLRPAYGQC
jgi:hypothetical protein